MPTTDDRQTTAITPFILVLPKAELHLHLEGSVDPATLRDLSGGNLTEEAIQGLYRYSDFFAFLMGFKQITEYLRTPDDYELVTYRLIERLAAESVLHAEVYVSVGVIHWRGQEFSPLFEGMERGRLRGERAFGVSLLWIFDAVRHFGPEAAQRVAETAVQFRPHNVVGFGIGGDERRGPPEQFRNVYRYAARHGLRLTAHAGEGAGPESVRGALDIGAERIGHGLTAIQDPALVERLRRNHVPVEVCLSSNLRTGCCASLQEHPLRRYFDAGLMVTLNTDDPAMFGTSPAREYFLAQQAFGFTDEELKILAMNSFRASFLPEERKRELLARFTPES